MSELAVTFRPCPEVDQRLASLDAPEQMRRHLFPRLHALTHYHLTASSLSLLIMTLVDSHTSRARVLPGTRRFVARRIDRMMPGIVDSLVAPEDARKIVGLMAIRDSAGPRHVVIPATDL